MHGGGRRIPLTGAERRALRRIEAELDAEDPMLSALLDGTAAPGRHAESVLWTCVGMAALLLVFGVAVGDAALQTLGFVLVLAAVVSLVRLSGRAER